MNADGTGDRPIDAERCPIYSRDGALLASLAYDGVRLPRDPRRRREPGSQRPASSRRRPHRSPTRCPRTGRASPGSSRAVTGDELWVAPVAGGPGIRSSRRRPYRASSQASPVWSPDGSSIAFGTYVADAVTGERRRIGDRCRRRRWIGSAPAHDSAGLARRRDVVVAGRPVPRLRRRPGRPADPASSARRPVDPVPARDMFVIGADGKGDRNVTNTAGSETAPGVVAGRDALAFETPPTARPTA